MTNEQLNSFLEILAKFIELNAKSVDEAVEIIRQSKIDSEHWRKKNLLEKIYWFLPIIIYINFKGDRFKRIV